MKCQGIRDPKYCLECPYPECLVDRNGNLPSDLSEKNVKKLVRCRIACRKYRETHKEQIRAYRQRPDVKERKKLIDKASKDKHRKAYNANNRVYHIAYYQKNREKILEKNRKYRDEHREEINARRREKYRCAHMNKKLDVSNVPSPTAC